MTSPVSVPFDALRGLIEELERYEGWLAALDARRETTPAHVLDRVRADYDGRLRGVRERIGAHVEPLRAEEAQLASREADVDRALAERQDELAEVELRTLVGEFAAEEGERRVQETAAAVRGLEGDRENVGRELMELRALLARAVGPMIVDSADSFDSDPVGASRSVPPSEAPGESGAPAEASEPPRDVFQSLAPPRGDDEAFVGTGERLDSLAASLGSSVAQATAPVAAAGQEKTLRCGECGEMNYPTEWYCERCGGELAAM